MIILIYSKNPLLNITGLYKYILSMKGGVDMSGEKKEIKLWKRWLIVITSGLLVGVAVAVAYVMFLKYKNGGSDQDDPAGVMKSDVKDEFMQEDSSVNSSNASRDTSSGKSGGQKVVDVSNTDISGLVDIMMPAVVSIKSTKDSGKSSYDSFEDYLYGYGTPYAVQSTGTGFIIGQNGSELLLATNNHVVEGAQSISVVFCDKTEATATLKGNSAAYDVAVISIDASKLEESTLKTIRIATIGNSDELKVGDMTFAIGNSLGDGQSVTVGYISAKDRTVTIQNKEMKLLQTDTVINDGNSGGPLVNVYGEVVGITNAKLATYSGNKVEGVCFAIPITEVVPIINELMNRVEIPESDIGYLGIGGKEVTESYAKAFNMPKGLYVSTVDKDSPAYRGGIRQGDIITSVNGCNIKNMDELKEVLSYIKYGTEVEIKYSSNEKDGYKEKTVKVVLGKRTEVRSR